MGHVAQIKWFGKNLCNTDLCQIHMGKCMGHTGNQGDRHTGIPRAQCCGHFNPVHARHAVIDHHEAKTAGVRVST